MVVVVVEGVAVVAHVVVGKLGAVVIAARSDHDMSTQLPSPDINS